jgi:hypothetical protein
LGLQHLLLRQMLRARDDLVRGLRLIQSALNQNNHDIIFTYLEGGLDILFLRSRIGNLRWLLHGRSLVRQYIVLNLWSWGHVVELLGSDVIFNDLLIP